MGVRAEGYVSGDSASLSRLDTTGMSVTATHQYHLERFLQTTCLPPWPAETGFQVSLGGPHTQSLHPVLTRLLPVPVPPSLAVIARVQFITPYSKCQFKFSATQNSPSLTASVSLPKK